MRQFVKLVVVLTALFASPAHADDWPARLIKATIPFGAGSAADVVPRVVFDRLAAELGSLSSLRIARAPAACSVRCR
jgi:tripartite-type tricarboxylate transporter receptor subunit TctC